MQDECEEQLNFSTVESIRVLLAINGLVSAMRQRAPLGRPPQKGKGEREVAGSSSKAAALGGGRDVAITGVGNYVDAQNDENDETNNNVAGSFGRGYAREKRTDYLAKFTRKKLNFESCKKIGSERRKPNLNPNLTEWVFRTAQGAPSPP